MPRVRVPEVTIGPPLTRWKRERELVVSAEEAEILVAEQGAVILDADEDPEPQAKAKAKAKTKAKG